MNPNDVQKKNCLTCPVDKLAFTQAELYLTVFKPVIASTN